MTILGLLGALLGFLAIPMFWRAHTFSRLAILVFVILVHVAVAQVYFLYTKSNVADSFGYYYYDAYFHAVPWSELGTTFVGHLTQLLKHRLGATYMDCFMVFQAFGAWGIIILLKIFEEIAQKTETEQPVFSSYLLFLPSMHFWTSSIGKDAPVFFCMALCTWSMLSPSKRAIPFVISITLMLLFRAHVALAASLAFALATLIDRQIRTGPKLVLIAFSVAGLLFLVGSVRSTFSVDVTDTSSLAHFFDSRSIAEASDTAGSSLSASLVVRFFSLLFRPLFVDAKNAFGLIASVENVGSILLIGYLLVHWLDVRALGKRVLFIRFGLFVTLILALILGVLNYNVGLGLRERVMLYPSLFSLFMAVVAYRRIVARSSAPNHPHGLVAVRASAGTGTSSMDLNRIKLGSNRHNQAESD